MSFVETKTSIPFPDRRTGRVVLRATNYKVVKDGGPLGVPEPRPRLATILIWDVTGGPGPMARLGQ